MTDHSIDFTELKFELIGDEIVYDPGVLNEFIRDNLEAFSDLEPWMLMGKIAEWYMAHLERGGIHNPAMDALMHGVFDGISN